MPSIGSTSVLEPVAQITLSGFSSLDEVCCHLVVQFYLNSVFLATMNVAAIMFVISPFPRR